MAKNPRRAPAPVIVPVMMPGISPSTNAIPNAVYPCHNSPDPSQTIATIPESQHRISHKTQKISLFSTVLFISKDSFVDNPGNAGRAMKLAHNTSEVNHD